jgi:hypothetical protein
MPLEENSSITSRYLRERDTAKLFSQLISGVWYIQKLFTEIYYSTATAMLLLQILVLPTALNTAQMTLCKRLAEALVTQPRACYQRRSLCRQCS